MKTLLTVSAVSDRPTLCRNLAEQLAGRRVYIGYINEKIFAGYKAIQTSSVETYLTGSVILDDLLQHLNVPFITRFYFTCTKEKDKNYRLMWAMSLS